MRLADEGLAVIGVPKTIDNDIAGTDITFGFETAVQIATDAIDRLATTAEAHNRVIVVEVMGRTKGWIATHAGLAGGADYILIPEYEYDIDEIVEVIQSRHRSRHRYSIVVVAEGIVPPAGYEGGETKKDSFGFERLGGVGRMNLELSHVGYVEGAGVFTDRAVLGEDSGVLLAFPVNLCSTLVA